MWRPSRTICRDDAQRTGLRWFPPSEAESSLALARQDNDGLALCINIGGYAGSSTRIELAAGIIAACVHGPVHVGSDSEVSVNKGNQLPIDIIHSRKPHFDFKLASGGDLWEHFYEAALAKGGMSIKLSWVKVHAMQEHIDSGICSAVKKAGNGRADLIADTATELHGQDLIKVASSLHTKHVNYGVFMQDVGTHMVEGYLIHRELPNQREMLENKAAASLDKGDLYTPLRYVDESECVPIVPTSSIGCSSSFSRANPKARFCEHFSAVSKLGP